eukprot:TRINITY_DN65462_c0_g1_i1.p2 TRINITY_DN65462_c0_g1~~TRINITY_DN65462_c0_g1_i1.p2  ORF type:complete len:607 (+),score=316.77 TRINITY_DN65462_c0_g1_i1:66-1886(+)
MAPKADKDGWVKVGPSKAALYRQRKEEEAAKERAKKVEEDLAKTGFNMLTKRKEEEAAAKAAAAAAAAAEEEAKKRPKTEAEKAAARKLRKKEKATKAKEEDTGKFTVPKASATLDKLASHVPKAVAESLRGLPKKYTGRVKDQFLTAVLHLNDMFPSGTLTHKNYKALPLKERWAQPVASDAKGAIAPFLHTIIDGSTDDAMWNATARDLIAQVFGRDGCRADEGSHFLGSKFALQVLLRYRPTAFTEKASAIEGTFLHEGGTMVGSAAINYSWVLAQLGDEAACDAVASWSRVYFYPRIAANEGKASGAASECGTALADYLAGLNPSDEVRKQYLNTTKHHDPLEKELFTVIPLVAPKMNRHIRLFSTIIPKFSVLFTPTSAHAYFTKLALSLRTANDVSRPLILDLIVECLVLDTGCIYAWGNDFLVLAKETSLILQHMGGKKDLRSKLDGAEFEKLFAKINSLCDGALDGSVPRPTGKKGKMCNYDEADLQSAKSWVKRSSGMAKAIPKNAPVTNKKAQQKLRQLAAEKKSSGVFTTLILFVILAVVSVWLALPYLPKEQADEIRKHLTTADTVVRKQSNEFLTFINPHIEKAAEAIKAQLA